MFNTNSRFKVGVPHFLMICMGVLNLARMVGFHLTIMNFPMWHSSIFLWLRLFSHMVTKHGTITIICLRGITNSATLDGTVIITQYLMDKTLGLSVIPLADMTYYNGTMPKKICMDGRGIPLNFL